MSLSTPGVKLGAPKICHSHSPYSRALYFKNGKSFASPSSTPGGDGHAPTEFFVGHLIFGVHAQKKKMKKIIILKK